MFEKLKEAQDNAKREYFEGREVEGIEEKDGRVVLTYQEGEPRIEEMTVQEWEAGKTEVAVKDPTELQKLFVKRTEPLRKEMAEVFRKFNPRMEDVPFILGRVNGGLMDGYNAAVDVVFGVQDFTINGDLDVVLKKTEEKGQDITKDFTDVEKEVFEVLRKNKVPLSTLIVQGTFLQSLKAKLDTLFDTALSIALGGDDHTRRCDDLDKILKDYAQNSKEGEQQTAVEAPVPSTESEPPASSEGEIPDNGSGGK